ncbi:hypothetical protein R6V09_23010 [Streptomyces sp. W16]|uniref:hypothetical protein n=1 Tax=Streptomyces sp. W16 TaxID=3076631 RepID=UPI00295BC2B3|nr:hypothetical protein [Streptomyces sp. W16]MDV9172971.1 hypothetical protein [Streptomyces sp. W16]
MSSPVRPPTPHVGRQVAQASRTRVASGICAFVLTLGHLVTAYMTLLAYAADPAGSWDSETVAHSDFAAGFALALTAATAGLSWVFVKAEWLRRRWYWYAIPAGLAVAAVLRLTSLAPEL